MMVSQVGWVVSQMEYSESIQVSGKNCQSLFGVILNNKKRMAVAIPDFPYAFSYGSNNRC